MDSISTLRKLENTLNDNQFQAATHMDGPAVIMAGAGSGKTHTLMSRVGYLVSNGCDPRRILMLTFTNAAADEMKSRAANTLDSKCADIVACTYHKFCNMMLRQYGDRIGIKDYSILSSNETKNLIDYVKNSDDAFRNLKGFPPASAVASIISTAVNKGISIGEVLDQENKYSKYTVYKHEIKILAKKVFAYCYTSQKYTYDGLLVYMNRLLSEEDICRRIAAKYKYIMIDEFQDTNDLQEEIILKLAKYNQNIVVVGDISQSIYAFRGANIKNLQNFGSNFADCKLFVLDQNYRSTQEILDAANAVMNRNVNSWTYYNMKAVDKTGEKPILVECNNAYSEATYILSEIQRLHSENGIPYSDIAVLERSSMSSFVLENLLSQNSLDFNKVGGMKFMDYECIGDVLAYFSVIVNPHDLLSWFRVLQLHPNIGNTFAKKVADGCSKDNFLVDNPYKKRKFYPELVSLNDNYTRFRKRSELMSLFEDIEQFYFATRAREVDESKMNDEARQEAMDKIESDKNVISALKKMAERYDSIVSFADDIMLDSVQNPSSISDLLTISTVHGAKGLEWSAVFILDCVEGAFPSKISPTEFGSEKDEEELRCFYVAMTRAKKALYLMVPEEMNTYNGTEYVDLCHYLAKSQDRFQHICGI